MFTLYAMAGVAAVIIGLWVTIKIMKARNASMKREVEIANANNEQMEKVVDSVEQVEEVKQERATDREERVKAKVEKDVKSGNFNDFYD